MSLNKNCSNLLTIPASTNKNMINSMMNFYKNSFPTIALTKLDESHISAEELSIFAELNCKIGILSGSRSIIGSIAFAKSEVLAQYMKDISVYKLKIRIIYDYNNCYNFRKRGSR